MKHEHKKHFDISKPRRLGPDPTSKPIIVGHHPMMPDPMVREQREKAAKPISVISEGDEPESLDVSHLPDLSDISATHETSPALAPSPGPAPEHTPGAVFSPTDIASKPIASQPESNMPEVPAATVIAHQVQPVPKEPAPPTTVEPPPGQELHIPAGHAAVDHKPRVWVWVLAIIIIAIWVYAAVDALTDTKLPYEFFTNLTAGSTSSY